MLVYELKENVSFNPENLPDVLRQKGVEITTKGSMTTITFPDGWEQDDNYDLPYSKRLADSGALKVIKEPDGVPSLRLLCVGTLSSHSYMVVGGKTGYPGLTIGPNAEKVLPPKN